VAKFRFVNQFAVLPQANRNVIEARLAASARPPQARDGDDERRSSQMGQLTGLESHALTVREARVAARAFHFDFVIVA
jgi:hypothetical protein